MSHSLTAPAYPPPPPARARYGLPLLWPHCVALPEVDDTYTDQERELVEALVPFQCDEGFYNELASLHLVEADVAIKQLFHYYPRGAQESYTTFSTSALLLFWASYLVMACITLGVAVPSGIFVPSLVSGAALGRLAGHVLHFVDTSSAAFFADAGTYALVGAAAGLACVCRISIAATVGLVKGTERTGPPAPCPRNNNSSCKYLRTEERGKTTR